MTTEIPRRCDRHTWAVTGVTAVDGTVTRVWIREDCPTWTRERLDERDEIDWRDATIRTP